MDTINEINTLKITFSDGTETMLPKWFTSQFDYFKNIIEDLGEEKETKDGKEYRYLELEFTEGGMGSDLGELLTKPILAFLKRLAYHIEFLGDDKDDFWGDEDLDSLKPVLNKETEWNSPDGYQTKMITKFIKDDKWHELFRIYFVTDYLGNSKICHAITDIIMKYFADHHMINIEKLLPMFNIKSQFTAAQQKEILSNFDWRD